MKSLVAGGACRKRVLIVSPVPPAPAYAGNRERVRTLIESLQARGARVCLIVCGPDPGDRNAIENMLHGDYVHHEMQYAVPDYPWWLKLASVISRGRAYYGRLRYLRSVDDIYCRGLNNTVRRVAGAFRPDIAIVEYVYLSAVLEVIDSSVLKVIDSHDVLGGRVWRFWRRGRPANAWTMSRGEETRGLDRADLVLAIQDAEAGDFKRRTKAAVITLGHRVAARPAVAVPRTGGRRILFVGSDNHLNKRGIDDFIRHCLPWIRERCPDAVLEVVGGICDFIDPAEGVELTATVPELSGPYGRADVVVNPVGFATGIAVKNLQAMAFGKPLVVLKEAARGMEDASGRAFLAAGSYREFAERIVRVLVDREFAGRLSAGALEYVRLSNQRCDASLDAVLSMRPRQRMSDDVTPAPPDVERFGEQA